MLIEYKPENTFAHTFAHKLKPQQCDCCNRSWEARRSKRAHVLNITHTHSCRNRKTHLRPGTWVARVPSRITQDTTGGGFPCAVQLTCAPVSLPNSRRGEGSSRNVGTRKPLVACEGITSQATAASSSSSRSRAVSAIVADKKKQKGKTG